MAKYKPKYCTPGTRRPGMVSRLCSFFAGLVNRPAKSRRVNPQKAVVSRQRTWQEGVFCRTTFLVLVLIVVGGAGGWHCLQTLADSNVFRLTTVTVQGNRMTRESRILDLAGIEQGVSLLSFDVGLAEERITSLPWIERAEISRSWPSTLKVDVYEYRPLAMVNIDNEKGQTLYYIDHSGKVFAPVESSQELDFPVITGIESSGVLTGETIAGQGLAAEAFRFLSLAARGNPIVPLQSISEVHLSPGKGLIVYLVDSPFPIYMGYDNINTRYYQLVKLLERLYRKKKIEEIKEIRMDYYEDRILVAKLES